jgi:hypothetical protein
MRSHNLALAAALGLAAALPVHAQPQPSPPAPAAPQAAAPAKPTINAKAVERLNEMGRYLRSLKAFSLTADITTDLVLDSGQKVEAARTVSLSARLPDRLYADVASALRHRQLYYDGKTVTIYGQKLNYYGTFPAPPTIGEMLTVSASKRGLEFPLSDLFAFGSDKTTAGISEALYLGPQRVGGVLCDLFAFRQPDVDWQVCIQRGKQPLPRKLIVTTTSEPAQPQQRSVLTWKTGVQLADARFKFVPPKGATRIAVAEMKS